MRKRITNAMSSLLNTVRETLYMDRARLANPEDILDPTFGPIGADRVIGFDDWMFASEEEKTREVNALSTQMDALADQMSGLEDTLALITGETAFPVETLTPRPCAMMHHDADLFDGEAEPRPPLQDNVVGGEGVFLFGDEPAFDETADQQAA